MLFDKMRIRGQLALEFLIVYTIVLAIFLMILYLVATQSSASLSNQQYYLLQQVAQNVAGYINQAQAAGNGYSATASLPGTIGVVPYDLYISNTGVVIVNLSVGGKVYTAVAFSNARNLNINTAGSAGAPTLTYENPVTSNGVAHYGYLSQERLYNLTYLKGRLALANHGGQVSINANYSTASPPQTLLAYVASSSEAALFNGQDSNVVLLGSSNLATGPAFTLSAWVDDLQPSDQSSTIADFLGSTLNLSNGQPCFTVHGVNTVPLCSANALAGGSWSLVSATLSSGSEALYLNGNEVASASLANTPTSRPQLGSVGTCSYCSSPNTFNGYITNLQAYPTALSANSLLLLYGLGIGAQPLPGATLWLPMDQGLNDHAGSHNGYGSNVSFAHVSEISAKLLSGGNSNSSNALIGAVAANGRLSLTRSYLGRTDANGDALLFDTSESQSGSDNLTIDAFNGDSALVGNLVAWFPLDLGYGQAAYGFTPNQVIQSSSVNPLWATPPANASSLMAARFVQGSPLYAAQGNVVAFDPQNTIQENGTLTVVAWINFSGTTPNCQGIAGDLSSGSGFELGGSGGCGAFNVSGISVPWPNLQQSFPQGSWEMVTGEYDSQNGTATVYLNSSPFASNAVGASLSLNAMANLTLGSDSWPTGLQQVFNGMITNVQVYSTILTPSQLAALYLQGPTAAPAERSGLAGWWPLDGDANDYSNTRNPAAYTENILWVNQQFSGQPAPGARAAVSFYQTQPSYITATLPSQSNNGIAVSLWFYPKDNGLWGASGSSTDLGDYWENLISGSDTPGSCGGAFSLDLITKTITPALRWTVGSSPASSVPAPSEYLDLTPNSWQNVVATENSTSIAVYVDGVEFGNSSYVGKLNSDVPAPSYNSLTLGGTNSLLAAPSSGCTPLSGYLADVMVYNRSLSQANALLLYRQGISPSASLNLSMG